MLPRREPPLASRGGDLLLGGVEDLVFTAAAAASAAGGGGPGGGCIAGLSVCLPVPCNRSPRKKNTIKTFVVNFELV